MTGYTELLEQAPDEVRTLVKQLRKNRLSFKLEHKGLDHLEDTIEHASRNISFALIIAAMFVGSSILILANKDPGWWQLSMVGIGGFTAAVVLTVLMVISNRRRDRDRSPAGHRNTR
jgi:ubiquinone biosynthesis protein